MCWRRYASSLTRSKRFLSDTGIVPANASRFVVPMAGRLDSSLVLFATHIHRFDELIPQRRSDEVRAAVDCKYRPGDVCGQRRGEKYRRLPDIVGLPVAAQRDDLLVPPVVFRRRKTAHALGTLDRPGDDTVGADAVLAPFDRQILH